MVDHRKRTGRTAWSKVQFRKALAHDKPCFRKAGSDPPVCEVHNLQLVQKELAAEMILAGYTSMNFLVCPVSGAVVD
jgi:hypothetical protein